MAVRLTDENENVEVHKGNKGGITGCGFDTTEHPNHWENTTNSITYNKNGGKN